VDKTKRCIDIYLVIVLKSSEVHEKKIKCRIAHIKFVQSHLHIWS